jgi:hypothetical protein
MGSAVFPLRLHAGCGFGRDPQGDPRDLRRAPRLRIDPITLLLAGRLAVEKV